MSSIVGELKMNAQILGFEIGHDFLEDIDFLGGDTHFLSLDGDLGLEFHLLDELDDLARFFDGNTCLESDDLADSPVGGVLDLSVGQRLEGDFPLDQLFLEDESQALEFEVVLRRERHLVFFENDVGPAVLEVETVPDLLDGRLDGVGHFLEIDP